MIIIIIIIYIYNIYYIYYIREQIKEWGSLRDSRNRGYGGKGRKGAFFLLSFLL